MSEICTNKRVAKIMPGRDTISGDLKAYTLQNTIILGNAGTGVENLVNGIILNLVQDYSPQQIGIQYYPIVEGGNPWLKETRKLPHFLNQSYGFWGNGIDSYRYHLCDCMIAALNYNREWEPCMFDDRINIIILEVDNKIMNDDITWNIIKALVRFSSETNYVKVFVVSRYNNPKLVELEPYIGLRLLTKTSEDLSNEFLGCNLSSRETDKYGFVWVTEVDKFDEKKKLSVDFKPDTYLNKVCKYLCSGVDLYDDAYSITMSQIGKPDIKLMKYFDAATEVSWDYRTQNENPCGNYNEATIQKMINMFATNVNDWMDRVDAVREEEIASYRD